MGILHKNISPVGDFHIEYLCGSRDVVFCPGSIVQGKENLNPKRGFMSDKSLGHVILEVKKAAGVSRVGITFEGTTKPINEEKETQLFTIQEILWDAAPSKGKAPAKDGIIETEDGLSRKVLRPTSEAGHTFLFAIKLPLVNFPPTLAPHRSVVQTEYTLRAFVKLSNSDEDILSE